MRRFFRAAQKALRRAVRPLIVRNRWRTEAVDELPDTLKPQRLYLIGGGVSWSAALLCPSGCGEVIQLSLLHDDTPSWRIHLDGDKLATLHPRCGAQKAVVHIFSFVTGQFTGAGHWTPRQTGALNYTKSLSPHD